MIAYADTHIHLDTPEAIDATADLLQQAQAAGIHRFVVPGVKPDNWETLLTLAQKNPAISIAPGLHPFFADHWSAATAQRLLKLTSRPEVVAIGEIGLDAIKGPGIEIQQQAFRAQLEIACAVHLPILLHSRKAVQLTLEMLDEFIDRGLVGGIWHGFSGSIQVAETLFERNLKIGVGTVLLSPSARRLPEVIRQLPLECFVLETDFPYRAEHPLALLEIAAKVAELKDISLAEVAAATLRTTTQLFTWNRP
jgi:TatD DNase family protein